MEDERMKCTDRQVGGRKGNERKREGRGGGKEIRIKGERKNRERREKVSVDEAVVERKKTKEEGGRRKTKEGIRREGR